MMKSCQCKSGINIKSFQILQPRTSRKLIKSDRQQKDIKFGTFFHDNVCCVCLIIGADVMSFSAVCPNIDDDKELERESPLSEIEHH